jgi:hypothetical protein
LRNDQRRRSLLATSGHAPSTGTFSRERRIGVVVTALALAAMAVDHLLDEDGGFTADPPAFAIAAAVCVILALLLFGALIPRVLARPDAAEQAATVGLALSLLAVATVPVLFLGPPFLLGGGGVALGQVGRTGSRRRRATAAVVLGAAVVILATAAYTVVAIDKLA